MMLFVALLLIITLISDRWQCVAHVRLYESNGTSKKDCLHRFWGNHIRGARELIEYCIRLNETGFNNPPVSSVSYRFSFNDLYLKNVSVIDLYNWFAPIDLIEEYHLYLHNDGPNHFYYNCTSPWFGRYCQYTFNSMLSFNDIVEQTFDGKESTLVQDAMQLSGNGTCYVHMLCNYVVPDLCLDWREICDGKIDCLNDAIDEENCVELETNMCDLSTEYRCRNGMCIPKTFTYDNDLDCLDYSDEPTSHEWDACKDRRTKSSMTCEEHSCSPMTFSCGYDDCLEDTRMRLSTELERNFCANGRDKLFQKSLLDFYSDKMSDYSLVCWTYLICTFKLAKQFNILCKLFMLRQCPSIVFFPTHPVVFGHVYFVYTSTKTDWFTNYAPDYICFNTEWCKHLNINIININGFNCSRYLQFDLLAKRYQDWNTLVKDVKNVFRSCSHRQLQIAHDKDNKCPHSTLIPCQNSSKCISKHRLSDAYIDCSNSWDENTIDTCKLNLTYRFKCGSSHHDDKCIPIVLMQDKRQDCPDNSDERLDYHHCTTNIKSDLCENSITTEQISFQQVCNAIVDVTQKSNMTDESDCPQEWPCETRYSKCNGVFNCPNGTDEQNCFIDIYNCKRGTHYCVDKNFKWMCLPLESFGDNIINCFGSYDERAHCRAQYPNNPEKRYRCMNDSKCISPTQLCNCVSDCPLNDDETMLCPWLDCSDTSEFMCRAGWEGKRCDIEYDCPGYEDELLCDLIDIPLIVLYFRTIDFLPHPTTKTEPAASAVTKHSFPFIEKEIIIDKNIFSWYCHRGILVQTNRPVNYYCFCPPAYYGNRCQYQSDRLSLVIRLKPLGLSNSIIVFKLFLFLLDEKQDIISFEQIMYYPTTEECFAKYYTYLLYPIQPKLKTNYSVRIDNFLVSTEQPVKYIQTWYFDVPFTFLPVSRIVAELELSESSAKSTRCNGLICIHGRCLQYVNTNKLFCYCDPGWFGIACQIKYACQCSQGSLCIGHIESESKSICVCPLGHIGSLCRVSYQPCRQESCANGGTCVPLDERTSGDRWIPQQQYACICSEQFYGRNCEQNSSLIHISIGKVESSAVLIHNVITYAEQSPTRLVFFKRLSFYQETITLYYKRPFVPDLTYIQLFDKENKNQSSTYYLAALVPRSYASKNISTTIADFYRCPHIRELFNSTILAFQSIQQMKYYQQPCQMKRFKCFHDNKQMCLCNKDNYVDCFDFNHNLPHCVENPCENNALCLQDEERCNPKSICICPTCYYGTLCQLTTTEYVLSLDAIIGPHIQRGIQIINQPFVVKLSLSIVSIMFATGIVSNTLAILTFKQPNTLVVGCGFYLLTSSIVSLCTMCIFIAKFFYLLLMQLLLSSNRNAIHINCILIEFLLKFLPTTVDWLNACVAVERAVTIITGVKFNKIKSKKAAKLVVFFVIISNIISALHDPVYRRLVDDIDEQRIWCIISFNQHAWLKYYNSSMNIIHFIVPFTINLISAIIVITGTAHARSTIHAQQSYGERLKEQFRELKHLFISPIILIMLVIPRLIISFVYVCMKSMNELYLFLFGYFISFIPAMATFIIFVVPSNTYRNEFFLSIKNL